MKVKLKNITDAKDLDVGDMIIFKNGDMRIIVYIHSTQCFGALDPLDGTICYAKSDSIEQLLKEHSNRVITRIIKKENLELIER